MNIVEWNVETITSGMYGDSLTVPICPSVMQRQAQECACETFNLHFESVFGPLSTSYAKRKKAEALDLFI